MIEQSQTPNPSDEPNPIPNKVAGGPHSATQSRLLTWQEEIRFHVNAFLDECADKDVSLMSHRGVRALRDDEIERMVDEWLPVYLENTAKSILFSIRRGLVRVEDGQVVPAKEGEPGAISPFSNEALEAMIASLESGHRYPRWAPLAS